MIDALNNLARALDNHAEAIRSLPIPAKPAPAPATVATIPAPAPKPTPAAAPAITLDQVQQALIAISNCRGAAEAKKIVKQFGASKAKEIGPEKWTEVLVACELTEEEKAELEGK